MQVIGSTLDRFFARCVTSFMPTDWDRDDPGAYFPLRLVWAWRVLLHPGLLTGFMIRSRDAAPRQSRRGSEVDASAV